MFCTIIGREDPHKKTCSVLRLMCRENAVICYAVRLVLDYSQDPYNVTRDVAPVGKTDSQFDTPC